MFIVEWILLVLLTWPAFIILCVLAVVVESAESHKFTAFLTIVIGYVAWKFFGIPDQSMFYASIAFIPVGLVWSIWRWRVYCKDVAEERKKLGDTKKDVLSRLELSDHTDKLVSWVIAWPVSVVERVLGDVVRIIRTIIMEWCADIYKKVAASAVKDFD